MRDPHNRHSSVDRGLVMTTGPVVADVRTVEATGLIAASPAGRPRGVRLGELGPPTAAMPDAAMAIRPETSGITRR